MDEQGRYYKRLKDEGVELAVACEIIDLTKTGKLAVDELNDDALNALKSLPTSDAVDVLQSLSKKDIENCSNNSQRVCDMIRSRKERSQKPQSKKKENPKQEPAQNKNQQPKHKNRPGTGGSKNAPPPPLLPSPGQGNMMPQPPPLMGQPPPHYMPQRPAFMRPPPSQSMPPNYGGPNYPAVPPYYGYGNFAGHDVPIDRTLDQNLERLKQLSSNTGYSRDSFSSDIGFSPPSDDNFRNQGYEIGRGGRGHDRGRGGRGHDRGRGGRGHDRDRKGQGHDRNSGGQSDDRGQSGQSDDRGRGGHRGRGGRGGHRGRGGQDGHGQNRNEFNSSMENINTGGDSPWSFGSTSNLHDHSNMSNMNRAYTSDMNLSSAKRGRGGQRGGSARGGRHDDRSSHDGNDHGKAYRGGNQGRGNRGRSRGEGKIKRNDAMSDSNEDDSDDASESSSIHGSCSNLKDVESKNKSRRKRRGGRGRNKSRKDSTHDEDDKDDDDDDDDVVDENEVFDFLLKECKGLVSFEEFQDKCHLFPPSYNIMKWLEKHRRRILLYFKGGSVAHVGPFYREATLCLDHNRLFKARACRSKKCENFHICKKFVAGHCKFGAKCRYGHSFKGDHNFTLMRKLGLDDETFTDEDLRILLQSRYPLLCSRYSHEGKCENSENCPDLHLCKRYIIGKCGRGESCNFGHNLRSNHNRWVLGMRGWLAPVMNDKEDFVKKVILIAHLRRQQKQDNDEDDDNLLSDDDEEGLSEEETEEAPVGVVKPVDRRNRFNKKSIASFEETTDSDASETEDTPQDVAELQKQLLNLSAKVQDLEKSASGVNRETNMELPEAADVRVPRKRPAPRPPSDTVMQKSWVMDDAENKPICNGYIAGTCSSCAKGHHPDIAVPYLWQIKHERWVTLDHQHNEHVEREFCDGEEVIDTELLWDGNSFDVHICRDGVRNHKAVVYACNGSLVDSAESFPVRRLSTESYGSNQETAGFYTQWRWYWKDDQSVWNTYDNGLFQKTLEVKYLFGQASYLFARTDFQFKYRIDFRTFKQVNLDTRKERLISRRPLFVSEDDVRARRYPQSFELSSSPEFPDNFSPWDMTSDFELVELDKLKEEFRTVKRNFTKTMESDIFQVTFIYRVQNRKLLNEYSTKKKNMVDDIRQEHDNRAVGEKILFHGTDSIDICRAICTNNFDFRTSGKNATVYGEGSYFAVRAKYSHSYTKPGPDRQRYIFQANVLTGLTVKGDRSYRRPPARPGQQHRLFDSCVDNEQNPDLFVIFDRSQSYPAYLIAYRELYNYAAETGALQPNPAPRVPPNPAPRVNPSPLQQRNPTQMTRVYSEPQQRYQASSEAAGLSRGHSEGQFQSQMSQESTQSELVYSRVFETSEASSQRSKNKDSCVLQ